MKTCKNCLFRTSHYCPKIGLNLPHDYENYVCKKWQLKGMPEKDYIIKTNNFRRVNK